ncbi:MAG: hydrogenobyrinate a,c-diamide synthase [Acidimicrobiales bacterium]|nr:MAG: hydrogenobyrinate a,c-diamide synthase [Acidimicrobiales bacterium]
MVAGTHSGVGKTTVAVGLMAAYTRAGRRVGAAKVGPDYIDPGYHQLAVGRPSRNLDVFLSGPDGVLAAAAAAARGADLLVVEGVMGMFDGIPRELAAGEGSERPDGSAVPDGSGAHVGSEAHGSPSPGSTAHVAELLAAPVLLVVDASSLGESVAAVVHGYSSWLGGPRVSGVVLEKVGSASHEEMLRRALEPLGVPVVGVLPRDEDLRWRDRHLGLIPVVEAPAGVKASIDRLATMVAERFDLDEIFALASEAPPLPTPVLPSPRPGGSCRVAVASGPAFSFYYHGNREALESAGAELVEFDPLSDRLPDCDAVVAGGGFPEVFAERLSENAPLLEDLRAAHRRGVVFWAECGGLLWLCESLDGVPMAGLIPARARMTDRLTLGYRLAVTRRDSPFGPAGTLLRGHEFHYSVVEPSGDGLEMRSRLGAGVGGWVADRVFASYLHMDLSSRPELAERFVGTATRSRPSDAHGGDAHGAGRRVGSRTDVC